jgi:hypothetical protein
MSICPSSSGSTTTPFHRYYSKFERRENFVGVAGAGISPVSLGISPLDCLLSSSCCTTLDLLQNSIPTDFRHRAIIREFAAYPADVGRAPDRWQSAPPALAPDQAWKCKTWRKSWRLRMRSWRGLNGGSVNIGRARRTLVAGSAVLVRRSTRNCARRAAAVDTSTTLQRQLVRSSRRSCSVRTSKTHWLLFIEFVQNAGVTPLHQQ